MEKKYNCPCCGHLTYPVPPKDDIGYICDVCWWENDLFIQSDDEPSDQNHGLTLNQAKANYRKYGISAPHLLGSWRKMQRMPEATEQVEGTEKRILFGSQVEINLKATIKWYDQGHRWGCGCDDCRNFMLLAHDMRLPRQMMELLSSLGILPEQATYVCQLYDDDKGHYYQVSYRIAGNLLQEAKADAAFFMEHIGHCCHETYPYGAPGFPEPHFDIEFFLTLPWVLDETDK